MGSFGSEEQFTPQTENETFGGDTFNGGSSFGDDTASDTFATDEIVDEVHGDGTFQRKVEGMSDEELRDPNRINVEIVDKKAPIVMLFGPPFCGKTMVLVRLTRYLKKNGYQVKPVESFRPGNDTYYSEMCNAFTDLISNDEVAASTGNISFMLVKVIKDGKTICQILEAPGELYHNPDQRENRDNPKKPFPRYVNTILGMPNKRIWTVFLDANWGVPDPVAKVVNKKEGQRSRYVERINFLKSQMAKTDKTVFVLHKVDLLGDEVNISRDEVNEKNAFKWTKDQFENVFDKFKNTNPITSFFNEYTCSFVPFRAGYFVQTASGKNTFENSSDAFPRRLWNKIYEQIRG